MKPDCLWPEYILTWPGANLQTQNMESLRIADLMKQTFIQQSIPEFVRKVYQLLQGNAYPQIIHWAPDEHTLVVRDQELLASQVLPVVFNQNTMRSFVRQLNMYGFKKIRKQGHEKELYFRNKHLMKNNLQELIFIKRKKRGYVQQESLEVRETKTICERYNIFVYGMLSKLCEVLHLPASLKDNANLMKYLKSLLHELSTGKNHFQSFQKLVDNVKILEENEQSYCNDFFRSLKSFKSFRSIEQVPCFKSAFSICEESNS